MPLTNWILGSVAGPCRKEARVTADHCGDVTGDCTLDQRLGTPKDLPPCREFLSPPTSDFRRHSNHAPCGMYSTCQCTYLIVFVTVHNGNPDSVCRSNPGIPAGTSRELVVTSHGDTAPRTLSTRRSVRVPSGSTTVMYTSSYFSSTGSASRLLFSRFRSHRMYSINSGQMT